MLTNSKNSSDGDKYVSHLYHVTNFKKFRNLFVIISKSKSFCHWPFAPQFKSTQRQCRIKNVPRWRHFPLSSIFFSDKQIQLLPDSCLSMSGWFWGLQINDLFSHSRTSFSTRRGWWILNYILIIIHQKPHSQQKIGSDSNLNWFSEVSEILSEYSI